MAITKTSSQSSTPSESSNNIQKSFFPYQRPVTRLNWRVIGKHIITNQKSSIIRSPHSISHITLHSSETIF